ncbi:hypothetical protein NQD34_010164 [Periophthalmus magnuspinnatus]|nr:hypothetical protein NQD34_010164 [Periophthalmus magnuspinnatus]
MIASQRSAVRRRRADPLLEVRAKRRARRRRKKEQGGGCGGRGGTGGKGGRGGGCGEEAGEGKAQTDCARAEQAGNTTDLIQRATKQAPTYRAVGEGGKRQQTLRRSFE